MALCREAARRRQGLAYALAIVLPLATLGGRLGLGFRPGDAPMVVLFLIPAIVSAYVGGLGPGLVATLAGGLLTDYYLMMPPGGTPLVAGFKSAQWLALLLVGSLVSALTEALHRSRRRFRAILESALDAIVVINHEGRIVEFNPTAEQMFGHAAGDVLGRSLGDVIVPPAMRERHRLGMARYLATGETHVLGRRTEMIALRADGREFPVEVSIQRVAGAGRPLFTGFIRDITERRQAEETMRRNEAILAQAQQIAHIGSWDLDLTNLEDVNVNPLHWSEELHRLFGYEPGSIEVSNDLFFHHVHPDDRGKVRDAVAETLRSGATYSIDHRIIRLDGTERVLHEQADLLRDPATGRPQRMVGTAQDVSAHLKAEEAMRASELRYRTLFEYAPDGIVIADAESNYIDANASACRMFGYTREEFIGLHASDIVVQSELEHIQPALSKLNQRFDYHRQWRFRRKDGSTFGAEVIATKMPDGNLLGMIRDITERQKAADTLRSSEERFRQLIENASDIIAVVDEAGVIRYQGPSTQRLLGYTPEEMVGRRSADFIHPGDHAKVAVSMGRAFAGQTNSTPVEFRFQHRDGSWRVLQAFGKAMIEADGAKRVVVNSRDVTGARKLEEQFRQSQKMEAIGQLSAGIAHDFNNLLTVIRGHVGLLRVKEQVSPQIAESVQQIDDAAGRAAKLTRQLLTFSRQEVLQPAEHNLNGLVANLGKMLRRLLSENIDMQVEFADVPLPISADEGMVEQVLLNLVVNARDAMPRGGALRIITTAVDFDEATARITPQARAGKFACVEVRDTWSGIPPEILPHVFEPFFTTKGVGKGTGLGLATVYGIMQQHAGWISVDSEAGQGATFRAYFPRLGAPLAAGPAPRAPDMPGGHETIMLVEDELAVRMVAEVALQGLGYRIFTASSGLAALQVWEEHKHEVELLLTDLVMPEGITGRELADRLKAENPKLPVVYMSGYSHDVAGGDFRLQEGVNYLPKPFDIARLAVIVRAALDRHASRPPFGAG